MEAILGAAAFVVMFGMWVIAPRYFRAEERE